MREFLFRGKRIATNDWVEGSLLNYCDGDYDICSPSDLPGELNKFCVYPETVSQYTGRTDKNGVKIFEEDICRFHGDEGYSDYAVFWDDTTSQWTVRQIDLGAKDVLDGYFAERCEVIGNIHDDPESLEVT